MLRKYVVGFERSGIFPLWLGSMMEKTRCGNRRDVPVFVFAHTTMRELHFDGSAREKNILTE